MNLKYSERCCWGYLACWFIFLLLWPKEYSKDIWWICSSLLEMHLQEYGCNPTAGIWMHFISVKVGAYFVVITGIILLVRIMQHDHKGSVGHRSNHISMCTEKILPTNYLHKRRCAILRFTLDQLDPYASGLLHCACFTTNTVSVHLINHIRECMNNYTRTKESCVRYNAI